MNINESSIKIDKDHRGIDRDHREIKERMEKDRTLDNNTDDWWECKYKLRKDHAK